MSISCLRWTRCLFLFLFVLVLFSLFAVRAYRKDVYLFIYVRIHIVYGRNLWYCIKVWGARCFDKQYNIQGERVDVRGGRRKESTCKMYAWGAWGWCTAEKKSGKKLKNFHESSARYVSQWNAICNLLNMMFSHSSSGVRQQPFCICKLCTHARTHTHSHDMRARKTVLCALCVSHIWLAHPCARTHKYTYMNTEPTRSLSTEHSTRHTRTHRSCEKPKMKPVIQFDKQFIIVIFLTLLCTQRIFGYDLSFGNGAWDIALNTQ